MTGLMKLLANSKPHLEERIMNKAKHTLTSPPAGTSLFNRFSLFAVMALLSFACRAADIDIYSGLSGAAGNPNVLIIMDNAANFDAATTATPCLINGVTNTMAKSASANSAGGIEQCALYSVISSLPVGKINIGFMVYNSSTMTDYLGTTNCTAAGSGGGCLAFPLVNMTSATQTALMNWIAGWTPSTIKTNSEATAEAMQEAWAYYAGQTGLSGRNYASIQPTAGCQKNFVIFIGNAFTSSASPGDGANTANAALASAYTIAGVANPGIILGTKNTTCGSYTFATSDSLHNNNGEYMDEWARFMKSTADLYPGTTGQQDIITYTIGLVDPASCKPAYPAVLASSASYGGGKYFETSSYNDIVNSLMKILNEIQAINSVFSSATLPVSVNTQGTYLNQIYMGMFRPDQLAAPRWVGNVKQYQFQFDSSGNLYLADATREPAISSAGTGFITPGAASFWSCTNSSQSATLSGPTQLAGYTTFIPYSTLPACGTDPTPGYWANNGNYVANTGGKAFDLPDGEVVEKGGAGQQIRLTNLTDDYTASPSSPRRLFTYCPSGTGCVANLTDPSNSYSTSNAGIVAAMYGTGLNLEIHTITRSGTTATVTTQGSHGLAVGNTVTIAGASPSDYNGLVTVTTVPALNQFTYSIPNEWPPSPATTTTTGGIGGYVASPQPGTTYPTTLNRAAAGAAANATVTATAPGNPFINGQQVTIAGATPTNYNLSPNITVVTAGSTFTYPMAINPTPAPTGSYVADLFYNTAVTIKTATCSSGATKLVTITTNTSHNFVNGDWVTISGDTETKPYNTSVNITWTSATSFTYVVGTCPGNAPTTATMVVNSGPSTPQAVTLTRNETAVGVATVTASVAAAGVFANGDHIVVALASGTQNGNETGYLTSGATITCAITLSTGVCGASGATTTFTYTTATTPATQASGSIISFPYLASSTQTIASLTRAPYPGGTTATATLTTGATVNGFCNGDTVSIQAAPGTNLAAHEGAYTGTWVITGTVPCTAATCAATTTLCSNLTTGTAYYGFTYGALTLTPTTPASGSMSASNPGTVPDRTLLTNWVRGQDNFGDELSLCPPGTTAGTSNCPNPADTIRPSVHGDTLHSRPIAINYGSSIGVVVYYGTNDGVYHAINGNQPPCTVPPCASPAPPTNITYTDPVTLSTVTVKPGGELWGFIAPEFYAKLNRQRTNSPPLMLPSTPSGITPKPQPKDYFIDGPTGIYQTIDGNGNTTRAIIYIGERRGGRTLTAIDVTHPATPVRLWSINNGTLGFDELGQTWSLPKIAMLKGYCGAAACSASNPSSPVLIFGAGYDDGSEDSEAPFSATFNGSTGNDGADNMGRGIFIIDALDGHIIWQSTHYPYWPFFWFSSPPTFSGSSCTGTPPAAVVCQTLGMNYSVPADPALIDKDMDGYIDRLYETDTGGNVWRMDFEPSAGNTPDKWRITQLAALGCPWGPCDTQLLSYPTYALPTTVQRKFFFPAEFIPATSVAQYDAVFVGSGDREHPLYVDPASTAANPLPLSVSPPYAVSAQAVVNRIYMIKDFNTGKDSITQTNPVTEKNLPLWTTTSTNGTSISMSLDDCTGTAANPNTCSTATTGAASPVDYSSLTEQQQHNGYFISLNPGEKVVNAPLVTAGFVYLGTNQPVVPAPNSCNTNLGVARGYQLNPYSSAHGSIIFDGGGLPPSPVSGIVDIQTAGGVVQAPFCIGCPNAIKPGNGGTGCNNSALEACKPNISVSSTRRRDYWYINNR